MPIDTKYTGYDESLGITKKVRDFHAGQDKVKAEGELYLPKLGGQTQTEYESYKLRGYVIPAVETTSSMIIGSITRRAPTYELIRQLNYVDYDMTGGGDDINSFIETVIQELNLAGGAVYLVEFDEVLKRPLVKTYPRESVINMSDNFVVLKQTYQAPSDKDKYIIENRTEYLELTFDESGYYVQKIWRESNKRLEIVDTREPTIKGERINYIPIVFCGRGALGIAAFKSSKPVLSHIANMNLDQYLLSTDLRHGMHWTALPTPFLFGSITDSDGNSKSLSLGSGRFNQIDDTQARVELLEFNGAGLSSIDKAIANVISDMASAGANMMLDSGGGVKAAETARIEASSKTALMMSIANTVDLVVNKVLEYFALWFESDNHGSFKANRDFIDVKLDPAHITALLKTWMSGGMSLHSFLVQLERAELLPKDISADDEIQRIETTGTDFNQAENNI